MKSKRFYLQFLYIPHRNCYKFNFLFNFQFCKHQLLLFMEGISKQMDERMHIGSQRKMTMKIPKEFLHESKARWNDALLGCVYTEEELNQEEVLSALKAKWKFGKKLEVLFHPDNRFVVRCEKLMDRSKLLREQPWALLGHLLFFKSLEQGKLPIDISFTVSPMWISFSGLLMEHEMPKIIKIIASAAGEVVEIYPNDTTQRPTRGFRAKVMIQLDQQLVQGSYADTIDQGYVWITYHYLGLPFFYCSSCFCLGHIAANCVKEIKPIMDTQDLITGVRGEAEDVLNMMDSMDTDKLTQNISGNMHSPTVVETVSKAKNKGKEVQLLREQALCNIDNPLAQIFGANTSQILGSSTSMGESTVKQVPDSVTVIDCPSSKTTTAKTSKYKGKPPRYGPRKDFISYTSHTKNKIGSSSTSILTNTIDQDKPYKKRKIQVCTGSSSPIVQDLEPYHPILPRNIEEDRSMIIQNTGRSLYTMELTSDILANPEVQSILLAQGLAIQPIWGDCNWIPNTESHHIREAIPLEPRIEPLQTISVEDYSSADMRVNHSSSSTRTSSTQGLTPYQTNQTSSNSSPTQVEDKNPGLLKGKMEQTYEKAIECFKTNYYGTKGVTEGLLPLLQLSNSANIVNVTSTYGKLKYIPSEKVKLELNNVENLTEERLDELIQQFLKDFKDDKLQANGWPLTVSAYKVSKAAINAYTRMLARKFRNMRINCVHPGYVKTDITCNTGVFTAEEGAQGPVKAALLPDDGPSGHYFNQINISTFE